MASPETSPRRSKTTSPISATEAVNVRDSWDVLDTPRSAQSESDYVDTQATTNKESTEQEVPSLRIEILSQEELRQKSDAKELKKSKKSRSAKQSTNKTESPKSTRWAADSPKRPTSANRQQSSHRPLSAKYSNSSSFHDTRSDQGRPISAGILRTSTSDSTRRTVIPRRYRKLGLRSSEQMLQDEYSALRHLLKDCENVSRSELREQHIEQTRNMIGEYHRPNILNYFIFHFIYFIKSMVSTRN